MVSELKTSSLELENSLEKMEALNEERNEKIKQQEEQISSMEVEIQQMYMNLDESRKDGSDSLSALTLVRTEAEELKMSLEQIQGWIPFSSLFCTFFVVPEKFFLFHIIVFIFPHR